jgi:hypothetical protein
MCFIRSVTYGRTRKILLESMEIVEPGLLAGSRPICNALIMEANEPLEKNLANQLAAPSVMNMLSADAQFPDGYLPQSPFASPLPRQTFGRSAYGLTINSQAYSAPAHRLLHADCVHNAVQQAYDGPCARLEI